MKDYLSQHSLSLIEDVGREEFLQRYINPKNRELTISEIERIALAEVK